MPAPGVLALTLLHRRVLCAGAQAVDSAGLPPLAAPAPGAAPFDASAILSEAPESLVAAACAIFSGGIYIAPSASGRYASELRAELVATRAKARGLRMAAIKKRMQRHVAAALAAAPVAAPAASSVVSAANLAALAGSAASQPASAASPKRRRVSLTSSVATQALPAVSPAAPPAAPPRFTSASPRGAGEPSLLGSTVSGESAANPFGGGREAAAAWAELQAFRAAAAAAQLTDAHSRALAPPVGATPVSLVPAVPVHVVPLEAVPLAQVSTQPPDSREACERALHVRRVHMRALHAHAPLPLHTRPLRACFCATCAWRVILCVPRVSPL
jgi:hypothetical protein